MHNLGMLNLSLSLAIIDEKDEVHQMRVKYRSLVCCVCEANKRAQAATERARRVENENLKIQKLLEVAKRQVVSFRSDYPEWVASSWETSATATKTTRRGANFVFSSISPHPHPPTYTHTYVHIMHTQKLDRDVDMEKQMAANGSNGFVDNDVGRTKAYIGEKETNTLERNVTHTCVYVGMQ